MKLSDTDLKQLNAAWALGLQLVQKDKLLVVLIDDLKEARERLAANSQNSSRPPRTDAPWTGVPGSDAQGEVPQTPGGAVADKPQPDAKAPPKGAQTEKTPPQDSSTPTPSAQDSPMPAPAAQDSSTPAPAAQDSPTTASSTQDSPTPAPAAPASEKRKVGHQKGDPGHGRALTLAVSATHTHMRSHCAVCQAALEANDFRPLGGHYVVSERKALLLIKIIWLDDIFETKISVKQSIYAVFRKLP
jgi:hypothetical protein